MSQIMHYLLNLFIISLTLLLKCDGISAKVDICGNTQDIDLSALDWTSWTLTDIKDNKFRTDFNISVCSPLNSSDSQCNNVSHICRHNRTDNQLIGYQLKSVESVPFATESRVRSAIVVFEGSVCNENPVQNYTIRITFSCGPHLEYPQHLIDSKCSTHLFWRTSAACKQKTNQNEVKCYVYDDEGHRRDLTPLIRPVGNPHRVLSEDREFYINVCTGITGKCSEGDAGSCLKTGDKFTKVGDYRYSSIEFVKSSEVSPYSYIQMTYKTRSSSACSQIDQNYTSVTNIRFICPPKLEKRSLDFIDRNPKLISTVDCEYQIEWMTEYACPQHTITANKCELTVEDHGIDFDLKSLMKSNDFYRIENISLNQTNNSFLYDIDFNVCGGLGSNYKCGDSQWNSNAVCLKSKNETKSKVIGISAGSLKLVDNRLLLEYKSSGDCKLDGVQIPESTVIEFLCDDSKGFEYKGRPEFVSFEDCVYNIVWKTSAVCPVISAKTSCVTTYKNLTFDLSPLRRGFGSPAWIASVSQTLPWSKHAKDEKDTIYLNFCGPLSKFGATESCDGRSSACMTIDGQNESINLGVFMSSPKYNEDIKAIELIYENGLDFRTKKQLKSKITLRCKPGSFDLSPTLIDIDEETGTYHFNWETWTACPINSFIGNDCKVYDSFLDYTFDLSPFRSKTPYKITTDAYDFEISICGPLNSKLCNENTIKTATGPFGICQVEKEGSKRAFSLGRMTTDITYWNGVINMTLTDGTPYNNPDKTPRKSHIAFICDPNAGHGSAPEFDGEKDRSYFFRWYTSLACPHTPKTVHCVWENSTHIIDLTPLAMSTGNHFTVSATTVPSIYYINVCRPLNPLHESTVSLNSCGSDSAVCRISIGPNHSALSLGVPNRSPFVGFDGSINLIYENGSVCPTNSKTRIKSLIKFECDPHSDLNNPIVHEPGHNETDGEECVYYFVWKTSAVCNAIKPTKIDSNSCVFTDPLTELSVDLNRLSLNRKESHKVFVRQKQSSYELNICGQSKPLTGECADSGVCYRSNVSSQSGVSYGHLNSSSFIYDGKDLTLRYTNGSKCTAHSTASTMSSEIIFKCNPDAVQNEPRIHSSHACVSVFEWETPVVCSLRPPECSIISNNTFYNLRQLSSMTVGWNTSKDGTDYYLNVCRPLPKTTANCGNGHKSASCRCKNQICNNLGQSSAKDLQVLENGDLLLTYADGEEDNDCDHGTTAQTQITFKCGKTTGNPKLIGFDKHLCVYKFEWSSFVACPVNPVNDRLLPERNGYLYDQRLEIHINIGPLLNQTFNVKEKRLNEKDNSTDEYTYVINLNSPELSTSTDCSKAAICQTKANGFKRDIGSIETIKYYLRGQELQIVLESNETRKCGRNQNKRVTTIFRLQCSSRSGVGEPVFMYESDDCDYTFNWETQQLCPQNFASISGTVGKVNEKTGTDNLPANNDSTTDSNKTNSDNSKSKTKSWIGGFIVMSFIVTLVLLFAFRQRVRQSVMFRFRRLFGPETTNHTFHYHQLASNERDRPKEEVVFISGSGAQNRNTIVAQPSGHVPYHSIYDDSDVDLLT